MVGGKIGGRESREGRGIRSTDWKRSEPQEKREFVDKNWKNGGENEEGGAESRRRGECRLNSRINNNDMEKMRLGGRGKKRAFR